MKTNYEVTRYHSSDSNSSVVYTDTSARRCRAEIRRRVKDLISDMIPDTTTYTVTRTRTSTRVDFQMRFGTTFFATYTITVAPESNPAESLYDTIQRKIQQETELAFEEGYQAAEDGIPAFNSYPLNTRQYKAFFAGYQSYSHNSITVESVFGD